MTKNIKKYKQTERNRKHDDGLLVTTTKKEDYTVVKQVSSLGESSNIDISVGHQETNIVIYFEP